VADDIVNRLRGQACPECGLPSTHNQFDEAADEIERLRAERDRWTRCAERLVEWENKDGYISALEFYRENQRLDTEAVNRGE
jgi:hypothetical protein